MTALPLRTPQPVGREAPRGVPTQAPQWLSQELPCRHLCRQPRPRQAVWVVGTETLPTASERHGATVTHPAPGTVLCLHRPSACHVQGRGQEAGPESNSTFPGHPPLHSRGPSPAQPQSLIMPQPHPKLWATVTFSSQLSHLPPPAQGLPSRWRQGSQRKGSM